MGKMTKYGNHPTNNPFILGFPSLLSFLFASLHRRIPLFLFLLRPLLLFLILVFLRVFLFLLLLSLLLLFLLLLLLFFFSFFPSFASAHKLLMTSSSLASFS